MQDKRLIIKKTIQQLLPSSKVILFGSRARQDYSNDSDYDILVITENELNIAQSRELKATIRKLLAGMKIPVDILIHCKQEVEMKKKTTGHIVKQALSEGILL